jgi:hypothetical protein
MKGQRMFDSLACASPDLVRHGAQLHQVHIAALFVRDAADSHAIAYLLTIAGDDAWRVAIPQVIVYNCAVLLCANVSVFF